jgi:type IV pilus assembly protein PilO
MAVNAETIAKLPIAQKLLALCALVVLIGFLYYLLLDKKYQDKINKLNEDLSSLKTEISQIRAIAADISKVERELALLEKKLQEAVKKLPNAAEVDKLLLTIDELGQENGLNFTGFRPGKESAKQLYTEVPIALRFSGNFFHILRFFDEITKLPRIVTISDVTMSSQGSRTKSTVLDVSCTATTYKFREEASAGGAGAQKQKKGG